MPHDISMIDAGRLTLHRMDRAPAGSLLFQAAAYGGGPYLAFRDPGDNEPRPYVLGLFGDSRLFCQANHAPGNGGHYLTLSGWRIEVDPTTAYMGTTDIPTAGDAFILQGRPGVVATFNHATIYVSADGEMLSEPNWGEDFVGFRKWAVVANGATDQIRHTIFEHERIKAER